MKEEFTNELSQFSAPSGQPAESAAQADAEQTPVSEPTESQVSAYSAFVDQPANSPAVPAEPAAPSAVAAPPIRIAVSALSDIGCVRTNNEDFYGYDESLGIFVVCDGMGGMASGEVASSLAVAAIVNSFAASASSGVPVSTRLLHAINTANLDVWENGQVPENKGMGTTVVAAALDGDRLILGNVGDSRAYILQGDQCAQLTVDHSYINELIRNGTLTIENAHNADLRGMESVITRAVGILAGSTFESACANLIHMAKQRGGQDNITCILILALPA